LRTINTMRIIQEADQLGVVERAGGMRLLAGVVRSDGRTLPGKGMAHHRG